MSNTIKFHDPIAQFNSIQPEKVIMMMMKMPCIKKNFYLIPFPLHILSKFSSLASVTQNPSPKSKIITDYLITSCGFSPNKAAAPSKYLANRRFPSKPDSVRHFLEDHGFSDAHIRTVITSYPYIICTDIDKVLQPNLQALAKFGFTDHELVKLIVRNPRVLVLSSAIARLDFWKAFLNGSNEKLLATFAANRDLINCNVDKNIVPKISLLKNYGLSETDIGWLLVNGRSPIYRSITSIETLLKKAQELGFRLGSTMFRYGFAMLNDVGTDGFMTKMELFKGFGWSEEDFLAALRKYPHFLRLAEENVKEKMGFLVGQAGCTLSYVASHPSLLAFSLDKRLMPRHNVMKILKLNGLVGRDYDTYYISKISEKKFMERFILRYMDNAPTLLQTYIAACAGKNPV